LSEARKVTAFIEAHVLQALSFLKLKLKKDRQFRAKMDDRELISQVSFLLNKCLKREDEKSLQNVVYEYLKQAEGGYRRLGRLGVD
jgi:hypothetical protein